MAKKFTEFFKSAKGPSILSRMTPNNLTATHRMMLARARIWNEVIGGNLSSGMKHARVPLKGESMERYFDYSFQEFIFPFKMDVDEANDEIDDFREIRNSRKGKTITKNPKRQLTNIPRPEAKRYLFFEKRRKEREASLNAKKATK